MRTALVLALALGCSGPSLSARGRAVVVLERDPGAECLALGQVSGSADPFFGGTKPEERLVEAARVDARNEAARAGATHLRFLRTERWPSGTFGGGNGVTVSGVAYRCGTPGRAPESIQAGCTKDTDCKGDRICESGQCTDPGRAPRR